MDIRFERGVEYDVASSWYSALCVAVASISLLFLTVDVHAQLIERVDVEAIMQKMMPSAARCERLSREPVSYCRYLVASSPNTVFEISYGDEGPASSLTYGSGSEGYKFLKTIRLFFSRLGVADQAVGECIDKSRSKPSELLAAGLQVKCRYTEFGDHEAYEVFSERQLTTDWRSAINRVMPSGSETSNAAVNRLDSRGLTDQLRSMIR